MVAFLGILEDYRARGCCSGEDIGRKGGDSATPEVLGTEHHWEPVRGTGTGTRNACSPSPRTSRGERVRDWYVYPHVHPKGNEDKYI